MFGKNEKEVADPWVTYEERINKLLGATSFNLVKIAYSERTKITSEWSGEAGFFLLGGSAQASGSTKDVLEKNATFAVQLPKDDSIIIVTVPADKIRLIVSDLHSVTLEIRDWSRTESHWGEGYTSRRLFTVPWIEQYVLHIPRDDVTKYISVAVGGSK